MDGRFALVVAMIVASVLHPDTAASSLAATLDGCPVEAPG